MKIEIGILIFWVTAIFFDSLMDSINFRNWGGFPKGGPTWHMAKLCMQGCFFLCILIPYHTLYGKWMFVFVLAIALMMATAFFQWLFYHNWFK